MKRFRSVARWLQAVFICVIVALVPSANGEEDEQAQLKKVTALDSSYLFKPVAITPGPDGEGYKGRFLFVNKSASPVMVFGYDEPANGKFEPAFIRYQTLDGGVWKERKLGYCGTGAEDFPIKPAESCEFHVNLGSFEEQETPLTGRIGFDVSTGVPGEWVEYWSYPFVLDWKKDRASGEFDTARKEHYKKLRSAFSKAGFRDGLLAGDNFCSGILQSMMKEIDGKEPAASFQPFLGKLDDIPFIQLDGKIRIDFSSDEVRNSDTCYKGWFQLDPRKFNPKWFHNAAEHHVVVGKRGDNGINMTIDDGSSWDSPLYFSINYLPFDGSKTPTEKESEMLFKKMLGALGTCLKE